MILKKLIYFLLIIKTIQSLPIPVKSNSTQKFDNTSSICPNVVNINNIYYVLEELYNITGIPADMNIHWKTNKIYYTLITEKMRMSLQVLEPTGEIVPIKMAALGQSSLVDNLNDIIYLATDNGVYKYIEDGTLALFTALGEDVMYIALTNEGKVMYIATWPHNRVHKITNEGRKITPFPTIPNGHGLTSDSKDNLYFVAAKTSYILKDTYTIPIKIKGLPTDKMTGIYVTKTDEVYAMDESSVLYSISRDATEAKDLGSFMLNGVNSFVIDAADNIIIGLKGAILKYKGHEKNPCTVVEKPIKKGKRNSKKRRLKKSTTTTTEATETEEDDED